MKTTMFGWMTPRGQYLECDFESHFDSVPELFKLYSTPELLDLWERVNTNLEECQLHCREHGEWHLFSLTLQDERGEVYAGLYEAGFLRVGVWGGVCHFEGNPESIKALFHEARALAEQNDLRVKFEPRQD
ncbi:MAG: hypothetical protein ACO3ZZ_09030 [Solirubrobacterales bacterium]